MSINLLELQAVGLDLIALESLILVHWNNCMTVEYVSRWGDLQDFAPGGGIPSG